SKIVCESRQRTVGCCPRIIEVVVLGSTNLLPLDRSSSKIVPNPFFKFFIKLKFPHNEMSYMTNEKILEKLDKIIELLTKLNEMVKRQEKQTETLMDPKEIVKRSIELQKELQKEMAKESIRDTGQYT
ncbi:MAG: hypothetical protein ACTSO9_12400, partial [Candidatus Helarchaeota archaeon]